MATTSIKAVTKFETSDGKLHDSQAEARTYEGTIQSRNEVAQILAEAGINSYNQGTAPLSLVTNLKRATALRDALNRAIRRTNEANARKSAAKAA
jgi:hypothetical protein